MSPNEIFVDAFLENSQHPSYDDIDPPKAPQTSQNHDLSTLHNSSAATTQQESTEENRTGNNNDGEPKRKVFLMLM